MKQTIKQDLKVGDSISLDNGRIVITMLKKSGQIARLDITKDSDVVVQLRKSAMSSMDHAQKGLTAKNT